MPTPLEKWERAKADYSAAIDDAKATKASEIATAKTTYQTVVQGNKVLSKAQKRAANKQAKTKYNATKAKASYKTTVNTAKATKNAAKAEYNATK